MPVSEMDRASAGDLIGLLTDSVGAILPGVTVTLSVDGRQRRVTTDANGMYRFSRVPIGQVNVKATLAGFSSNEASFIFEGDPRRLDMRLDVLGPSETVNVVSESVRDLKAEEASAFQQAPSQNIVNMQRKVAGVLPVRIDVPRAGTAYRFVRPLVLNDETSVSFRYKRR